MCGHEFFDATAELLQALGLVGLQRLHHGFAPGLEMLEVGFVEGFGGFVGVVGHARVGQQKVPDFVGLAGLLDRGAARSFFVPGGFGFFVQAAGLVDLVACTEEAVVVE